MHTNSNFDFEDKPHGKIKIKFKIKSSEIRIRKKTPDFAKEKAHRSKKTYTRNPKFKKDTEDAA